MKDLEQHIIEALNMLGNRLGLAITPCPFCSSTNLSAEQDVFNYDIGYSTRIVCVECGAEGPHGYAGYGLQSPEKEIHEAAKKLSVRRAWERWNDRSEKE